jgi:MoaA/NifB/PqqE/SkfB family radical SAM enzyme
MRLIKNGIRFRYQHYTGRADRPAAASFEITHDCIAKCVMCNIWKIPPQVPNLSVDQWLQILASPLFESKRTGHHGRRTLPGEAPARPI